MLLFLGICFKMSFLTWNLWKLNCCSLGGIKYLKAVEWNIPVVGIHWLNDIVLGDLNALKLPIQVHYLLQNNQMTDSSGSIFHVDPSKVSHLLGWFYLNFIIMNEVLIHLSLQIKLGKVETRNWWYSATFIWKLICLKILLIHWSENEMY